MAPKARSNRLGGASRPLISGSDLQALQKSTSEAGLTSKRSAESESDEEVEQSPNPQKGMSRGKRKESKHGKKGRSLFMPPG